MNDTDNLKFKRNLSALVEYSRVINSNLDLSFILNNLLFTCLGKFHSTKAIFAINENNRLKIISSKGIPDNLIKEFPDVECDENLFDKENVKEFVSKTKLVLCEKITSSRGTLGIFCLGEKLNKSDYSIDDVEFLKTILNISATAIENSLIVKELKQVNRLLDTKLNRLSSLFELSKEFGIITEEERVAKLLVYSIIGQFLVSLYAVVTINEEGYKILDTKFPQEKLLSELNKIKPEKFNSVLNKSEIINKYNELAELKVELIIPMQIQNYTKGLIILGKRITNTEYSETDIEFISSIGGLAIISFENKRLFNEALEKQKLEEELEIARDIQRNLLPHSIPVINNYEVAASNISSKQVGGDYYDIIKLNDNSYCFAIADVSGKGVPASLLMANLQAFLKVTCRSKIEISEATGLINDMVSENTMDGKFITFFWGILNTEEKTFEYVNAGHNPPLLLRDGKLMKLEKGGIILGVMQTLIPYVSEKIELKKNDMIVMFTDGVNEAMNKYGEEFSDEKLEELILKNNGKSAEEIHNIIKKSVSQFSHGAVQSDDITIMVLKSI